MKLELSENVLAQINEQNDKVNELCGYPSNDVRNWFKDLQEKETVTVGYRASCGSTDKTMKIYRIWIKVTKILKKNGVKLIEENVPTINRSPTSANGFWNEVRFSVADA